MVKMQIAGIQIQVHINDVPFYKRAGYSVVEEKAVETPPVEVPSQQVDAVHIESPKKVKEK